MLLVLEENWDLLLWVSKAHLESVLPLHPVNHLLLTVFLVFPVFPVPVLVVFLVLPFPYYRDSPSYAQELAYTHRYL